MHRSFSASASISLLIFFSLPFVTLAQTQLDLQSTIRAAIAADPRTQGMTEVQIDAMVDALAQRAQNQGLTPDDITWRPISDVPRTQMVIISCGAFPTIFCTLSYSLGFIGADYTIPLWLLLASFLMIVIIMLMRHEHYRAAQAAALTPTQGS